MKPGGDITHFVDGVIDSSRYYVLRLKDRASTRSALMGVGFRERETGFDFKNALNDYVRYIDRMATADKAKQLREESSANDIAEGNERVENRGERNNTVVSLSQHRDLSIPAGQKITIKSKAKPLTVRSPDGCSFESNTDSPVLRMNILRDCESQSISAASSPLKKFLLAPPPHATLFHDTHETSKFEEFTEILNSNYVEDEEEWGDFGSASIVP